MKAFGVLLTVVLLLGACVVPTATPQASGPGPLSTPQATLPPLSTPTPNSSPSSGSLAGLPSLADLVQIVKPAVVSIRVETLVPGFFFQPIPQEGAGSGFIFDPQGYILTNNHVIEGAQTIEITLPDGRTFDAILVGAEPDQDLAVLKIEGKDFPTLPFGDSSKLRQGDWVLALGNALSLEGGPTVTKGIIGALGRSIQEPDGVVLNNLIQTDAAINPGNSGGPLVNLNGEVVGINTAIAVEQGLPAQGIGFAIASNAARQNAEQLIAQAQTPKPFLGVQLATVTPALARQLGLSTRQGALVQVVQPNTPAARAGLRESDVIVRFGGQDIATADQLLNMLRTRRVKVGETVEVLVVRGSRQQTLSVTLGQAQ